MDSLWQATNPLDASPDELTPGDHFDTVVAGAGITGVATAVLLARSGQRVAVLEARRVGAVTTGGTTGKVSLLQGTVLSQIRRFHSDDVLRAYVQANLEGQAWLRHHLEQHGVEAQERTAYSYATTPEGSARLRDELTACRIAGLDARWAGETELPFAVHSALELPGQLQIDPMTALEALLRELRERGGAVYEGVRLTDASSGFPVQIETTAGKVSAEHLVLATGTPVLDRGAYFAKLLPLRSYLLAFRVPDADLPQGMYLSVDKTTRSLRTADVGDGELLLVGGSGHVVGRGGSTKRRVDDLVHWTQLNFPGARRTHAWSAQDYRTLNRVPFVGKLPRGGGHIWLATGFNKWGLANAVAAALNLSGQILGGHMEWAEKLGSRITKPAGVLEALRTNAGVAAHLAGGWTKGLANPADPPVGGGDVGRDGTRLVASTTSGGRTCHVSGVCTHLGGVVEWNDAEESWDCPLHGSRFAPDGTVLEGPATKPLPSVD
ncbi:FAD-dependent oxidoreductase [Tessaracoccus terricola]